MIDDNFSHLNEMIKAFIGSRKEVLPSKFWMVLNQKNITQLKESGYKNFKRTVAHNYFTWIIRTKFWKDDQIKFLYSNLPVLSTIKNIFRAIKSMLINRTKYLKIHQNIIYNFLTYMLWDYASKHDFKNILSKIEEPTEGNPPKIYLDGKLISQDLANSFLEYQSIMSQINQEEIDTILELGPGYGRTAYIFLKLLPNLKYLFVDIPPALYIAETYISNQFKEKKIFRFRRFNSYDEIKEDYEDSDIVFLLPAQLDLLPSETADLFINISSLHEMRLDQIDHYFNCIDKLIKKYVYIKQWKVSVLKYEDLVITEKDYPIRKDWKQIYWRDCKVKTKFFEALYRKF
ncbi:MAG: putative sugar O-methyltransferase [Promethearchaeota archaeon]